MAHIRKHPRTGKSQVRWRDPGTGRERTKSFDRASDAREFKARIETEINRGSYIDRTRGRVPFDQLAEEWLDNKLHLRESSWSRDESYLRNHVLPQF